MGDTLMEAYESYFRKPANVSDRERPKSLRRYEWTEVQYISQQPPSSPIRSLSPRPIQRFQGQLSPYRAYSPQHIRTPPLSPMRQTPMRGSPNRFLNQFRSSSPIVPRTQPYQFVPIEQSVIDNLQNPYRTFVDQIPITQQERFHVGSRMAVPQVHPPQILVQHQYQPQPVYQSVHQPQPVYQPPALSQVVPLHYHPAIQTPVFHSQVQPLMYQQQLPQQQQQQYRHSEPPKNRDSIKRGRSPPTKQPFDFARILNKLIE